jgi:GAF domain-containing protein
LVAADDSKRLDAAIRPGIPLIAEAEGGLQDCGFPLPKFSMPSTQEAARQRELDTYRIVDTLPETAYDDIVRLASILCQAPIALISLIDRDRQWLKAREGLELTETPRDVAFCDHAIRDPEHLMEVPDTTRDPRLMHNPLVTQAEGMRFYAGMPLTTPSGAAIGTVCVLDRIPRELTAVQRAGLASLARITMNLLEARHRELDLERQLRLQALPAPPPSREPEAPVIAEPQHFSVAVFEVQDYAGAVTRSGERSVERALQQLDRRLEACLEPGQGDALSRSTGSPESIVVLHGDDVAARLERLQAALPEFERQNGLRVMSAWARSQAPGDSLDLVFLRADSALSQAKDAGIGDRAG